MRSDPTIVMTWPLCLGGMGGGTVGVLQISRHLKQAGADVVLVSVTSRGREERRPFRRARIPPDFARRSAERIAELRDSGIEVVPLRPSFAHYTLDGLPVRAAVRRILTARAVDAVLGWEQELSFLPGLLRARGIASGMFAAGRYGSMVPNRGFADRHVRALTRARTLRRVDRVFAISRFVADRLTAELGVDPARIRIASWGVDPVFAAVERAPAGPIERLLFYGSADKRKGGFETVRACAALAADGVLGDGWQLKVIWQHRAEVEQLALELGLAGRVIALEPMPQSGLARELAWAQVAVLPSTYESFGLACAEAQNAGLPVIAYDIGGVGEVVADRETGWLVAPGRVDLLSACLREAIADPRRTHAMGLAGRARASRQFQWSHTAEVVLEGLAEVRGAPAGSRSGL